MIYFYSGTPGSGKSLSMAKQVEFWLKVLGKNVIANVHIDRNKILKNEKLRKKGGKFYYFDNEHITVDNLYMYALKFHKLGVESQSLVVIDEAQVIFSPTVIKINSMFNKQYRQDWLDFFCHHRHLGFDILIISQFDRLIDPQIRCLFEYNYVHRKANNFGMIGNLLTIFHIPLFVQIQKWYGANEVCSTKFFTYRKKYAEIYDSYAYRGKVVQMLTERYGEDKMMKIMGIRPNKIKEEKEEIKDKEEENK